MFHVQSAALDYESDTLTLTFSHGVQGPQSMCGRYDIIDDILVENDETITVSESCFCAEHARD